MGWADLLFKMGLRYGSDESLELAEKLMKFINETAHAASAALAKKKGPYPATQGVIERNATCTCIAPTGTISLLAGCSSGIEPVFALEQERRMITRTGETEHLTIVHPEYALAKARRDDHRIDMGVFVTAHDIPPKEHIAMQAAFQKHTDLAVSKTVNMPNSATLSDVREAFKEAWLAGCKGVTVYRDGCKSSGQVLYHKCPVCKEGVLVHQDGCLLCPDCGYSPCSV
jgi:ribonucleoside-diphosphate reductase alpha chain